MNIEINKYLDATGLLCPEPVMLLHKAVKELAVGEIIKVTATDPSTIRDIPKFCLFLGYELLQQAQDNGTYVYCIRKN